MVHWDSSYKKNVLFARGEQDGEILDLGGFDSYRVKEFIDAIRIHLEYISYKKNVLTKIEITEKSGEVIHKARIRV